MYIIKILSIIPVYFDILWSRDSIIMIFWNPELDFKNQKWIWTYFFSLYRRAELNVVQQWKNNNLLSFGKLAYLKMLIINSTLRKKILDKQSTHANIYRRKNNQTRKPPNLPKENIQHQRKCFCFAKYL